MFLRSISIDRMNVAEAHPTSILTKLLENMPTTFGEDSTLVIYGKTATTHPVAMCLLKLDDHRQHVEPAPKVLSQT